MATLHDPQHRLPDEVGMVADGRGVRVVHASSMGILRSWTWSEILQVRSGRQSDDPTDMDAFTVEIFGAGTYGFECDHADVFVTMLEDRGERSDRGQGTVPAAARGANGAAPKKRAG